MITSSKSKIVSRIQIFTYIKVYNAQHVLNLDRNTSRQKYMICNGHWYFVRILQANLDWEHPNHVKLKSDGNGVAYFHLFHILNTRLRLLQFSARVALHCRVYRVMLVLFMVRSPSLITTFMSGVIKCVIFSSHIFAFLDAIVFLSPLCRERFLYFVFCIWHFDHLHVWGELLPLLFIIICTLPPLPLT